MRSFIAFAALCAVLSVHPTIAEEVPNKDAVRIKADQKAKAFVFIIDDEPVAMLDKEGLHVVEGIHYGRSLSDTGPDAIREHIASLVSEAANE